MSFIERLKVIWHVLTKRNYIYFGLGKNAVDFDEEGNYIGVKSNKIASYNSIEDIKFQSDAGTVPLEDFMWAAISTYAQQQIATSSLKDEKKNSYEVQ